MFVLQFCRMATVAVVIVMALVEETAESEKLLAYLQFIVFHMHVVYTNTKLFFCQDVKSFHQPSHSRKVRHCILGQWICESIHH